MAWPTNQESETNLPIEEWDDQPYSGGIDEKHWDDTRQRNENNNKGYYSGSKRMNQYRRNQYSEYHHDVPRGNRNRNYGRQYQPKSKQVYVPKNSSNHENKNDTVESSTKKESSPRIENAPLHPDNEDLHVKEKHDTYSRPTNRPKVSHSIRPPPLRPRTYEYENDNKDTAFHHNNHWRENDNYRYNEQEYSFTNDKNLSNRAAVMAQQIMDEAYDCMICQLKVGRSSKIWTCAKCCAIFHLGCIDRWARANESKQAEAQHRLPRKDNEIRGMKCPGCNYNNEDYCVGDYRCYCKKNGEMSLQNYKRYNSIPHSCGEMCGKPRGVGCPHTCIAICHPGPCKPCPLPAKNVSHCECGRMEYRLKCGEEELQKRLCDEVCGSLLSCGKHHCTMKCHHGQCMQCTVRNEATCFCGNQKKELNCGEGIEIKTPDEKTQLSFSCNQICNKVLSCGKHYCRFKCHSGSCSGCPRIISNPTRCACGKTNMPNSPLRTSCLDPLPTCGNACDRMLACGDHFCPQSCHDSACPPCVVPVKKRCRCGMEEKTIKCNEFVKRQQEMIDDGKEEKAANDWIRCREKCNRILTCGIHKCKERCCPGKNQRLAAYPGHQCREVCNKPLPCGRHKCLSLCHSGPCGSCGVTLREGLSCACGAEYIPGPILCGTVTLPNCKNRCLKYLDCGHRCNDYCHFGPCNRCSVHVSIPCQTHGTLVHNVPCYTKTVSCGKQCQKTLPCKNHICQRACHANSCVTDAEGKEIANGGCNAKCGLVLPCGHKCGNKCHPGKNCDASTCQEHVRIMCVCGAREDVQRCGGRKVEDIRAIACGDVCKIAERNKKLREAFNIKPSSKQMEEEEKKADKRVPYPTSLLERCVRQMNDEALALSSSSSPQIPHLVLRIEKIFSDFLADNTEDMKSFASLHLDCEVMSFNNILLPKMSREERFIVFAMIPHYNLRGEIHQDREGKNGNFLHVIVTKTQDHSVIPRMLLSKALKEYQINKEDVETLESCPPERMIVIDDGSEVTSATLTDRLRAWSGDYVMWRNDKMQIFFVFTNEELRNGALTVVSKFGGRKANEADSAAAYASKKQKASQKKERQRKKKDQQQVEQQKAKQMANANKKGLKHNGWKTVAHTSSTSEQEVSTQNSLLSGINLRNRFG